MAWRGTCWGMAIRTAQAFLAGLQPTVTRSRLGSRKGVEGGMKAAGKPGGRETRAFAPRPFQKQPPRCIERQPGRFEGLGPVAGRGPFPKRTTKERVSVHLAGHHRRMHEL